MGWCPHRGGKPSPYREPYTLVSADGKRFALAFDCKQCVMMVKEKGEQTLTIVPPSTSIKIKPQHR